MSETLGPQNSKSVQVLRRLRVAGRGSVPWYLDCYNLSSEYLTMKTLKIWASIFYNYPCVYKYFLVCVCVGGNVYFSLCGDQRKTLGVCHHHALHLWQICFLLFSGLPVSRYSAISTFHNSIGTLDYKHVISFLALCDL